MNIQILRPVPAKSMFQRDQGQKKGGRNRQ